jgi:large subunit ribosomal protein L17
MSSHMIRGRQLSRDTEHRKSLRRSLVQSLFEHGKIKTTLPKAKEVRAFAEKLITLARTGTLTARRRVISYMNDRRLVDEQQEFTGQSVVQKLFSEVAPKFADRPGGYTRIIKTAKHRIGDGGSIVVLELAHEASPPKGTVRRSAGLRRKRNERKHQFASRLKKGEKANPEAATAAPAAPAAESKPE